jgi:hypothetical protein
MSDKTANYLIKELAHCRLRSLSLTEMDLENDHIASM